MKTEYRVVCARFTKPYHGQHHKTKNDKRTAVRSVINQNAEVAAMKSRHLDALEAPYRLQTRQVTKWKNTK